MNPKPFENCGGCKLYKEKCHCLCHSTITAGGYHEIIYNSGPGPLVVELPGERDQ
jgi:hypothetical protein